MTSCWQVDPGKRPTCDEIYKQLKKLKLDDSDLDASSAPKPQYVDGDGEVEMSSFSMEPGDESNYLPTGNYTGLQGSAT